MEIILVILIGVVIYVLGGMRIVNQYQRGVVLTLGKFTGIREPGLRIVFPGLQHSLNVAKLCEFYCKSYPIINRDLLITAALCHDIGKTVELSSFPENDYTDEGQLLGHIVIGYDIISKKADSIEGFPLKLLNELKHCILAHHGELEYGSPKKPALIEALALSLADNTDAKLETMKGLLEAADENAEWLGYNRMFESNIRRTVL